MDPFQDLFNQNAVRTPDGRYFLPFSKTYTGQDQAKAMSRFDGITDPATLRDMGYDPAKMLSYANPGDGPEATPQYFSSLQDYFNAVDPGQASSFGDPGKQNVLGINMRGMTAEQVAALRGNYGGEAGYYFTPEQLAGANPARVGGKPNESGLWQALSLLAPAVGGIASYGLDSIAGNATSLAGEGAGAGGSISGSAGSSTLTGNAASDTVVPSATDSGLDTVTPDAATPQATDPTAAPQTATPTTSNPVDAVPPTPPSSNTPNYASTPGLTAAEIAQLTPAALAAYNAFTGSSNKGNATANNAAGTAAQISNDQWNYYKNNYQPLESNLIGQAQAAGSPEEFARARGAANADVTGAFDTARKNTLNRLQSYGINPGSPAFQSAAASTDIAEGATKAGALTAADNNTRNLAYSKALDVVGLGKGIPAQSAASAASAANAATAASREKFAQNTSNMQNAGYGLNTVNNVASKWFGNNTTNPSANYTGSMIASPTNYGDPYSTTDPAYGASGGKVKPNSIGYAEGGAVIDAERAGPGQYDATTLKGVLQKRGLSDVNAHAESAKAAMRHKGAITPHMRHFAVGGGVGRQGLEGPDASNMGQLQGPGTETSDSIPATIDGEQPAALSTGEVVMNAAVPKLSGDEILAALNEAGLRKRQQHGLESQPEPQVPPNAMAPTYRRGGPVMRYGLGA